MVFGIYFLVSIVALFMFGSDISSNIMENLAEIDDWESYTI